MPASATTVTAKRLRRLERVLAAAGFTVRYERGQFRAGACVVHERRVIVVSRFFDPEARLRALEALAPTLQLDPGAVADAGDRASLTELRA